MYENKSLFSAVLCIGAVAAFAYGADYAFIGNGDSFDNNTAQWLEGLAPDNTDTAADAIINTGEGGAFYSYMDGKVGDAAGNNCSCNSLTARKNVGF